MAEGPAPDREPRDGGAVEPSEVVDDRESPAPEVVRDTVAGQGLIEYGLAIMITVLIIIAILMLVGPRIGSIFSRITQLG